MTIKEYNSVFFSRNVHRPNSIIMVVQFLTTEKMKRKQKRNGFKQRVRIN